MSEDFLFKRGLLIDDNEIDRFVHRKLLIHHGLCKELSEQGSAREALDYLEQLKPEEIPQLILLDLMMPEMDGFEFMSYYRRLVEKWPSAPKLFMVSSTEDDEDMRRARQDQHIIRLLHKPLSPVLLRNYLKEAID